MLLTLTRADQQQQLILENLDRITRQSVGSALQGQALNPKQKQIMDALPGKISAAVREEMSWAKVGPLYAQIYRDNFTQEEIDGMIAFYRSPAGTALVEKMPNVMQKTNSVIMARMGPVMEKMKNMQQQAIAEIKATK
jgi:hypothetical protein